MDLVERTGADLTTARRRVASAGSSELLGRLLRGERDRLPTSRELDRRQQNRDALSISLGLDSLRLEEDVKRLPEALSLNLSALDEADSIDALESDTEQDLIDLFDQRRALYDDLIAATNQLQSTVAELDFEDRKYRLVVEEYARFLDERLLWIPSSPVFGSWSDARIATSFAALVAPTTFAALWDGIVGKAQRDPVRTLILLALPIIVIVLSSRIRGLIRSLDARVGRYRQDSILATLGSLLGTIALSIAWPFLAVAIGLQLRSALSAPEGVQALGHGLTASGVFVAVGLATWSLTRKDGVLDLHFRWNAAVLSTVNRYLPWLIIVVAPGSFMVWTFDHLVDRTHSDGLGRLAFMVEMLALSVVSWFVLLGPRSIIEALYSERRTALVYQTRYVWAGALILLPIGLGLFAFAGYFLTAREVLYRVVISGEVLVAVALGYGVLRRWVAVAKGRIAFRQRVERLQ